MGYETLIWQPSRTTLRVAAFFDLFLFAWVLAMLTSYWIVVDFNKCEMSGVAVDNLPSFWLFIETMCTDDPGSRSMRGSCKMFNAKEAEDFPPAEELYQWRAIQACVAICCAFTFIMFWLLCFGARAPALANVRGCSKFDKRKCQEVCIAFTVIIIAFSIGTVGTLYNSDSFDPDAWKASVEEMSGITCEVSVNDPRLERFGHVACCTFAAAPRSCTFVSERRPCLCAYMFRQQVTTSPGPAVPMAFLSVFSSVIILGILSCPGCHCLGCHEPGKCCAKCVDQSVDAEGTSEI